MGETILKHSWLRALGPDDMPPEITLSDGRYRHLRTFKHDFFAATGLYGGPAGRVVLKLGRTVPLFGLPMIWLGEWLGHREAVLYALVHDIEGVPSYRGRWGRTGLVHTFVEGHPLQRDERVAPDFFTRLEHLLETIHARGIAYVDLEKRENILVDDHGRPWLIDFQISWRDASAVERRQGLRGPDALQRLLPASLRRLILDRLQSADRYHLLKHRRRHQPDGLSFSEIAQSYQAGRSIRLHRRLFRPLTLLRRAALRRLTGRSRSPKQEGAEFLEPIPDSDPSEQPVGSAHRLIRR